LWDFGRIFGEQSLLVWSISPLAIKKETASNIMENILTIAQVISSVGMIITILFQQRGGGGSAIFGGGGGGYYSKRGLEKKLFIATIILAAIFVTASFLNLFF